MTTAARCIGALTVHRQTATTRGNGAANTDDSGCHRHGWGVNGGVLWNRQTLAGLTVMPERNPTILPQQEDEGLACTTMYTL